MWSHLSDFYVIFCDNTDYASIFSMILCVNVNIINTLFDIRIICNYIDNEVHFIRIFISPFLSNNQLILLFN